MGSVVEGMVVRITTFGAFVELEPGLDGLVHISQCATTRIAKVEDAVNVGDIIRVKVLDVNTEAKRISLSIREVLEDEALSDVPDDDYAIDDVQAEEAPVEETPAEEAPVEEVPAEEAPAEEAPADET
ncbi:MAG: S1 RNA-binding domain-containing protein [Clostridia bacterium]|nr:S1 RNA-binding domain-containing protein [Clostridia bacterium]